ncbi:MAG: preprotein translocase subunit YajC [Gammaproteobacteria bacterium]|nr:preprotein translocase subunit YajC [Gammaproteobacteria bacterium]MBV9620395.1 preprotein translocase subunit YajC [Gammaproteobacteria bacterium]
MNGLISAAWAQAAPNASGPLSPLSPLLMVVVFVAIFYFLLFRPQQKRAREHQSLVSRLSAGDEVVTNGGLLGRVTEVGDTFVTLEVAEGVRVKVQKVQIQQLVPKGTLKSA